MRASVTDKARELCRRTAAGIVALALTLLGAMNLQVYGSAYVMPVFPVMLVFFWAIYWPEVMPRWFVFLLGVFYDTLFHLPLGLSSLLLLLLWSLITSQRTPLLKEPFMIIWLVFSLSASLYGALEWLGNSLYYRHFFSDATLWMRYLFTILTYPLIHKLLNSVHKIILRP